MSVNLPKQAHCAALVKGGNNFGVGWSMPGTTLRESGGGRQCLWCWKWFTRVWLAGWRCPSFSCVSWYIPSQLLPLGCPHLVNIAGSGTSCLQSKWHHCHCDALKHHEDVTRVISPEEMLWSALAWPCSVCERWWCGEFCQGCVQSFAVGFVPFSRG